MIKVWASNMLRNIGLIFIVDKIRYYVLSVKQSKKNSLFLKEHPDVIIPPAYLIYESFHMDYRAYYESGEKNANELISVFSKYIDFDQKKILDWGCGPGRIIRHFPKLLNNCEFYGTDYNRESIDWCSSNLKDIEFNHNSLNPKLPYINDFFDVIYGISIFTHLSEEMHYSWLNELLRVLKPGGILLVTAQGDGFKIKLSASEKQRYENGKLVVRGKVKEGHRTFSAFQPKKFMEIFFKDVQILDHIVDEPQNDWIPQDQWIVKKIQ
ncbi:class I SAM-dependent methyltransferase [Aquimarina sp. 2201CG5-10]|uniref:class I SAM-dependent methyltransferase n=1 Tax=Aquimarina callyspongiae TaxID=3098150 RepID=UPI002AB420D3|nr:class I SAM-dependent methyltransferase [Aquimarina sp. 2201CG5-10]MDY8138919.1 class I SAM-dependent methyltransferase [Aquimarina sp. 2201CG5-10]